MANIPTERIMGIVDREVPRLRAIPAETTAKKPGPGKWSGREILGHLVDSALNNHQRFVRAQLTSALEFPGYAQNDWVRCQGYAETDWAELIELWAAVNRHLARVIDRIPGSAMSMAIRIGEGEPKLLSEVITDYLRHVEHHLEQI